jgi:dihydropteroate synthase
MFTLNCRGRLLTFDSPIVMGIINVTPDSFYSGSRQSTVDAALQKAEQMINEGATILDLGGQSTRPNSKQISAQEETERVCPAIEAIHKQFSDAIISVDTYYTFVAEQAVQAGASIVNDISGGTLDYNMLSTVAKLKAPYICMHMKGTPENMQQHAVYANVTREVLDYFIHRIDICKKAGINDVIIDPGFGFAKTIAHNFELLHNLSVFVMLEKPIVAGLSRKSTVYKTLGITAEEALNGTTVMNTLALLNGANILRVHDVREAVEAIKLVAKYLKQVH